METPRIDHSITLEVAEQLIDGTKFPDIEGLMPGCFTTEILADRTPLGTVYGPKPSIRQVLAFHLKKSPEEITPQDFVEWWGQLTPEKSKEPISEVRIDPDEFAEAFADLLRKEGIL